MICFTDNKLTPVPVLFGWCGTCRRERHMLRTRWMCTLLAGAVTSACILASTSDAATWDGGGGGGNVNWTTAANWAGDIAPIAGDVLQFDGTTNLINNNDFAANTSF